MSEQKTLLAWLGAICGFVWIAAAIHPLDHQAWILENILLLNFRRCAGSDISPTTPFEGILSFARNVRAASHHRRALYLRADAGRTLGARLLWFVAKSLRPICPRRLCFLLAYPIRELLLRFSGIKRAWSFWLPPAVILAVSGLFEIIESIVAGIVAPGQGVRWLGGQGDEWDAQNDMLSAMVGSLLMMGIVALRERKNIDR